MNPPLITADWGHNLAFISVINNIFSNLDMLMNGRGDIRNYENTVANTTIVKNPYHISFENAKKGESCKKYILRIINTSFDATFGFSIDNHGLQIVSSDFVPVQPYYNTSV